MNKKFLVKDSNSYSSFVIGELLGSTENGSLLISVPKGIKFLNEDVSEFQTLTVLPENVFELFNFENITLKTKLFNVKRGIEYKVTLIDFAENKVTIESLDSKEKSIIPLTDEGIAYNHLTEIKDSGLEKTFRTIDLTDLFKFLTKEASKSLPEQENIALPALRRLRAIEAKVKDLELEAEIVVKDIARAFNLTKKVPSKLNIGQIEEVYVSSWKEVWEKIDELYKRSISGS